MHYLFRHDFAALQNIDLGDGTNTTGLILPKDYHKAANRGQVFDRANGSLEDYDTSIKDNYNNTVRLRQDKTLSRKLDCQAEIQTAKRVGKKFVLSRVEETCWLA